MPSLTGVQLKVAGPALKPGPYSSKLGGLSMFATAQVLQNSSEGASMRPRRQPDALSEGGSQGVLGTHLHHLLIPRAPPGLHATG